MFCPDLRNLFRTVVDAILSSHFGRVRWVAESFFGFLGQFKGLGCAFTQPCHYPHTVVQRLIEIPFLLRQLVMENDPYYRGFASIDVVSPFVTKTVDELGDINLTKLITARVNCECVKLWVSMLRGSYLIRAILAYPLV